MPNESTATHVAPHPEHGELLATRRKGTPDWVVYSILALLLLLPLIGLMVAAFAPPYSGFNALAWWSRPLFLLGGLLVAWFIYLIYANLSVVVRFHERGVTLRRFGRTLVEMSYESISRFSCATTRQYYNGIYVGTSLTIMMKSPGRKTITFSGRHKEKSAGLGFTMFHKAFKGEDEIDTIKVIIARAMVGGMLGAADAFSLDWAGTGVFTPAGFTPKRKPLRGTLVPFAQFERVSADKGFFHCWRPSEKKPFVSVPINGENFYPGLELLAIMQAADAA